MVIVNLQTGALMERFARDGPANGDVFRHICRSKSVQLRPHRVTWIKTKRKGEESG